MIVKLKAKGKERPRGTKDKYGKTKYYTPGKTKAFENAIKNEWYFNGGGYYEGALEANVIVTYEPPKSISKKKRAELIGTPYLKKPDGDNIVKGIFDALNNVAYEDDRFIFSHSLKKYYGEEDTIEIEIREVDASCPSYINKKGEIGK